MGQALWIQKGIALGDQFHCGEKNPWLHNTVNLICLGFLLLGMIGLGYLSIFIGAPLYLPLAILGFGFLSLSLFVLVVHEASHNMFILSEKWKRKTRWNEFFGWLVCGFFGINYRDHWEVGHLIHHLHPMEPQDPQICNPRTGRELFRWIVKILILPGFAYKAALHGGGVEYDCPAAQLYKLNIKGIVLALTMWIPFAVLSVLYLSWALPVSVFLATRILGVLTVIKSALEHGGEIGFESNPFLRQRTSIFRFRSLFLPFNICYHFEHHLNYFVPWYDLGIYHKKLKPIIPVQIQSFIFNKEIFKQIRGNKASFPPVLRHLLE